MRRLSSGARVKDESLKQELLEEKGPRSGDATSWQQADLATQTAMRPPSSVTVLVPTQARRGFAEEVAIGSGRK